MENESEVHESTEMAAASRVKVDPHRASMLARLHDQAKVVKLAIGNPDVPGDFCFTGIVEACELATTLNGEPILLTTDNRLLIYDAEEMLIRSLDNVDTEPESNVQAFLGDFIFGDDIGFTMMSLGLRARYHI